MTVAARLPVVRMERVRATRIGRILGRGHAQHSLTRTRVSVFFIALRSDLL